jgi:beta-glucosidase-like glycosyl hydrolase
MCAYNAVQGVPSCTSPLLKAQLEAWNYSGYVTSDSDAVADAWKPFDPKNHNGGGHGAFKTAAEASCAAVTKGWCDINSGDTFKKSLAEGVVR